MKKRKYKHSKQKKSFKTLIIIFIFAVALGTVLKFKWSLSSSSNNSTVIVHNKNINAKEPSPKFQEEPKKIPRDTYSEVILTTVGDCTLGRDDKFSYDWSLPHVLEKNSNDYSYIFENVYSIFNSDDITVANLEGAFTNSTAKADKQFTFKAPPEYAKILTAGSIEGVNLSNNHIRDYLNKGFEDTKLALEAEKVNYFGEGNVWIEEVKGVKFGFLGYKGFYASDELLANLKKDIASLKNQNCVIVINFHWGDESHYENNATQKQIAHYAIDNGADLIIGHHPHVIQGIEQYKNKLIFYSLGNFAFGGNKNPRDKNTIIPQIKFKFKNNLFDTYELRVIPAKISSVNNINDYRPTPAAGDEKIRILNKLSELSPNLGFELDGNFHSISLK